MTHMPTDEVKNNVTIREKARWHPLSIWQREDRCDSIMSTSYINKFIHRHLHKSRLPASEQIDDAENKNPTPAPASNPTPLILHLQVMQDSSVPGGERQRGDVVKKEETTTEPVKKEETTAEPVKREETLPEATGEF